jgi:hypothetical protein
MQEKSKYIYSWFRVNFITLHILCTFYHKTTDLRTYFTKLQFNIIVYHKTIVILYNIS